MRRLKVIDYTCGLSATIVGLGLYSYYVREILASLLLFTAAFFSLSLVALGMVLIWRASKKVTIWIPSASRDVSAFPAVSSSLTANLELRRDVATGLGLCTSEQTSAFLSSKMLLWEK